MRKVERDTRELGPVQMKSNDKAGKLALILISIVLASGPVSTNFTIITCGAGEPEPASLDRPPPVLSHILGSHFPQKTHSWFLSL